MNWKHIIEQLSGLGLTQADIATKCGCTQAAISHLSTGQSKEPTYKIGSALQALLKREQRAAKRRKVDAATSEV